MAYELDNQFESDGRIIRYQSVEVLVALDAAGRVNFPDIENLRGSITQCVMYIPKIAATVSCQTGSAPVAAYDDDSLAFLTFVSGSDQRIENIPVLALNPFSTSTANDNTSVFLKQLFKNIKIDWNKCYIEMRGAPSGNPIYMNFGIWYYYPKNSSAGLQSRSIKQGRR